MDVHAAEKLIKQASEQAELKFRTEYKAQIKAKNIRIAALELENSRLRKLLIFNANLPRKES